MAPSKQWFLVRLLVLAAVLLPLLPLFIWAFSLRWYFPDLLPSEWSGRAWVYIASPGARVGLALWNSFTIATATTLFSLLVGIPAGRALALYQFRGKTVVEFLILAPTIVPPLAVSMGIHILFIRYGLADTWLGVVLVHLIPVTPYLVLIMRAVFANFNPDYESQAQTLGANQWQQFWYVTWPLIFPGVVVGSLFAFIISWSQYLLTLLIGGGQLLTLPVLLFSFATSGDNSLTAALSLVFMAPAVFLLLITSRYFGQNTLSNFGKL